MTNNEFSDAFSTLLNSYNTLAHFGEEASKREIVLDEYEKSVLLTQALDIVVKTYFDSTLNNQAQGFDDTTRRQVDFSSLIKVEDLTPTGDNSSAFDSRGIIFQMPRKKVLKSNAVGDTNSIDKNIYEPVPGDNTNMTDSNYPYVLVKDTTDVLFILNEKLNAKTVVATTTVGQTGWYLSSSDEDGALKVVGTVEDATSEIAATDPRLNPEIENGWKETTTYQDGDYVIYKEATTTITYNNHGLGKDYIIVPISYKEYDREMSKPFAQPLKKQAWRLFQNNAAGFDVNSELIPKWTIRVTDTRDSSDVDEETSLEKNDIILTYKIRYVKRPRPIILEDLPDDLVIDGENMYSTCELNPILHMDILNKAVELAVQTRGNGVVPNGSANLQGLPVRQSQRD